MPTDELSLCVLTETLKKQPIKHRAQQNDSFFVLFRMASVVRGTILHVPLLSSVLTSHSTITQPTRWRFFQLVNVERAAVTNTDVSCPAAAVVAPVKAHFGVANLTS